MSSRRSPRRHDVHTRHPRYTVRQYERGQRVEYPSGYLRNSRDPQIFYPEQKPSDFKRGDVVGIWEIDESGSWYLQRHWKVDEIRGDTFIMSHPVYGSKISHFGAKNQAQRMIKMSRRDSHYDFFKGKVMGARNMKDLSRVLKTVSYSSLPESDKKDLFEYARASPANKYT